jgi:hypothetical protein
MNTTGMFRISNLGFLICFGFLISSFGFSANTTDVAKLLDRYCISCHVDELISASITEPNRRKT